ncbi:hypothetical protein [Streptomyces sp. NPDC050534]|uniref:hypothetical protein n=1 Tax=Streptomyces sp. NPDC050534 TaxID=3365625 RepID=UPI00379763B9
MACRGRRELILLIWDRKIDPGKVFDLTRACPRPRHAVDDTSALRPPARRTRWT